MSSSINVSVITVSNFIKIEKKLCNFGNEKMNFEQLKSFIIRPDVITTTSEFLVLLLGKGKRIKPQELLTAYTIVYYDKLLEDGSSYSSFFIKYNPTNNTDETTKMNIAVSVLKASAQDLVTNFKFCIYTDKPGARSVFERSAKEFLDALYTWKELDQSNLLESLAKSYFEGFELHSSSRENSEVFFERYKQNVFSKFRMLGFDIERAHEYLQRYQSQNQDQTQSKEQTLETIQEQVNLDIFKQELLQKPPDISRILTLIEETRKRLNKLSGNSPKIWNETNSNLDPEKLEKKINYRINNSRYPLFDVPELLGIMEYILFRIRLLENPSEHIYTDRWLDYINQTVAIDRSFNYSEIIPNFFVTVVFKLNKLESSSFQHQSVAR